MYVRMYVTHGCSVALMSVPAYVFAHIGYTGFMCGTCDTSYYRVAAYCKPCPSYNAYNGQMAFSIIVHLSVTFLLFFKRWSHNASLFVLMRAMHGFFFISQYDFRWTGQPSSVCRHGDLLRTLALMYPRINSLLSTTHFVQL